MSREQESEVHAVASEETLPAEWEGDLPPLLVVEDVPVAATEVAAFVEALVAVAEAAIQAEMAQGKTGGGAVDAVGMVVEPVRERSSLCMEEKAVQGDV